MKYNLLLVFMIFMCLGNLQAQSDATLEETINWINEHSIPNQVSECISCGATVKKISYDKTTNKLHIQVYHESDGSDNSTYIDHKPEFYNRMEMLTHGKGYALNFFRKNKFYFHFSWDDKDLALRTVKAFQHFFNLLDHDIKIENKLVDENKF